MTSVPTHVNYVVATKKPGHGGKTMPSGVPTATPGQAPAAPGAPLAHAAPERPQTGKLAADAKHVEAQQKPIEAARAGSQESGVSSAMNVMMGKADKLAREDGDTHPRLDRKLEISAKATGDAKIQAYKATMNEAIMIEGKWHEAAKTKVASQIEGDPGLTQGQKDALLDKVPPPPPPSEADLHDQLGVNPVISQAGNDWALHRKAPDMTQLLTIARTKAEFHLMSDMAERGNWPVETKHMNAIMRCSNPELRHQLAKAIVAPPEGRESPMREAVKLAQTPDDKRAVKAIKALVEGKDPGWLAASDTKVERQIKAVMNDHPPATSAPNNLKALKGEDQINRVIQGGLERGTPMRDMLPYASTRADFEQLAFMAAKRPDSPIDPSTARAIAKCSNPELRNVLARALAKPDAGGIPPKDAVAGHMKSKADQAAWDHVLKFIDQQG